MKEYFHDLLLPLGVDEEITDGILKNGLSIPSGIPGLTFSVTLNQDITLENNGKYWKRIFTVPAQWSGFSGIWEFYFPVSGNHS